MMEFSSQRERQDIHREKERWGWGGEEEEREREKERLMKVNNFHGSFSS